MNVRLAPTLATYVREQVESGRYASAEEVVGETLLLLRKSAGDADTKLQSLRAAVQLGIDAIERGEYTTYDGASIHSLADEIKTGAKAQRRVIEPADAA